MYKIFNDIATSQFKILDLGTGGGKNYLRIFLI